MRDTDEIGVVRSPAPTSSTATRAKHTTRESGSTAAMVGAGSTRAISVDGTPTDISGSPGARSSSSSVAATTSIRRRSRSRCIAIRTSRWPRRSAGRMRTPEKCPLPTSSCARAPASGESELLAFAAEYIGERAAVPKVVRIIPQIPVTAVGKIFKPALVVREIENVVREEAAAAGASLDAVDVLGPPARDGRARAPAGAVGRVAICARSLCIRGGIPRSVNAIE